MYLRIDSGASWELKKHDRLKRFVMEKRVRLPAQAAEWLAAAWNGQAHDAFEGVCFFKGRARPCQGAANVVSGMTCFNSRQRMRARPTGGVAEDASARAMTAGLAFSIVYLKESDLMRVVTPLGL